METGTAMNKDFKNLIFQHVENLEQDLDQNLERHRSGKLGPDREQNDADQQHWVTGTCPFSNYVLIDYCQRWLERLTA
jgi:hypothetical protein